VCYTFQLKKHNVPHTWRDHKMDRIVTPQTTIG
jgi:5-formyltetrahydrofolate cyclo-ligase